MEHPECRTHGSGYANRRGAANHHRADRFGDFAIVRVGVVNFLGGQAALVQHNHATVGPFDGLGNVHRIRDVPDNPFIVAKAATENECSRAGGNARKAMGADNGRYGNHRVIAKMKQKAGEDGASASAYGRENDPDDNE